MEEGGRGGGGGDGLTDKCYKRALIKPLRMVECNGVNLTSMRKKTVCHRVLSRAHDGKDCFKIYNPLAFPWKTASISTSVKLFACFREDCGDVVEISLVKKKKRKKEWTTMVRRFTCFATCCWINFSERYLYFYTTYC